MSQNNLCRPTNRSGSSGPSALPADLPKNFIIDEAFLLKAIEDLANADHLAQALNDRRIRDCLRDRGIKFLLPGDECPRENSRRGFYTLPLELRDKVREHVVDLHRGPWGISGLAPLACVDTEWRDAIEAITFQLLGKWRLKPSDLPLFKKYLVGKRRQYLKHLRVCLDFETRIYELVATEEEATEIYMNDLGLFIRRLFTILSEWENHEPSHSSSGLRLSLVHDIPDGLLLKPGLEESLRELPIVSVITNLTVAELIYYDQILP